MNRYEATIVNAMRGGGSPAGSGGVTGIGPLGGDPADITPERPDNRAPNLPKSEGLNEIDPEERVRQGRGYVNEELANMKANPDNLDNANLIGGDPSRNANMLSARETLRRSRLADALNARWYRDTGRIGLITDEGPYSGASAGERYQMQAETEEQRAQERAGINQQVVRAAEIARQQKLKGMALEASWQRIEANLRKIEGITEEEISRHKQQFEMIARWRDLDYETQQRMFETQMNRFFTDIKISDYAARKAANLLLSEPVRGGMFAEAAMGIIAPSPAQTALMNWIGKEAQAWPKDGSPAAFIQHISKIGTDAGIEGFNGIIEAFRNNNIALLDNLTKRRK